MHSATLNAAPACDLRTLTTQVRAAGCLDRRHLYYGTKISLTIAAFLAGWLGFFVLGATWATLGIAVFLGVMSTQLGFLGHDAGHGQVFASPRANRLLGLGIGNGLIGLSFGWWVPKHNAHHAHPNQVGRDPDIGVATPPTPGLDGHSGATSRIACWLNRWQVELFFPLMLLRSMGLYVSGVQGLLRRRDRAAVREGLLLAAHISVYLTAVLWVLPWTEAVAFVAVHQAVFSIYLGFSFAPNHKGMPLLERDSTAGFARRQIVTARNVAGGRCTTFVLGGLNYQIEHHLFPTMPRPNLARARDLVRAFCLQGDLGYCEVGPLRSFRQVVRGLRAGHSSLPSPLESLTTSCVVIGRDG